jgi:hypothetical protein
MIWEGGPATLYAQRYHASATPRRGGRRRGVAFFRECNFDHTLEWSPEFSARVRVQVLPRQPLRNDPPSHLQLTLAE